MISDTISCPTGSLDEKKRKKIVLLLHQSPYFLPLDLVPLLPNDLPSNPGLDLPFFLSFLLSFLAAILSVRFFCFAAIEATICSFRSSLNNTNHHNCFHFHKTKKNAYQAFLLFAFSFSFLLTAFFNLVSSSRIFVPSRRASALSHFSFSSMDLRFSSDMVASFSLRAASCSRACEGSDVVLSRSAFFDEDLLMILPNVMFVSFA